MQSQQEVYFPDPYNQYRLLARYRSENRCRTTFDHSFHHRIILLVKPAKQESQTGGGLICFLSILIGGSLALWVTALLLGGVVKITWEFREFSTVVDYYTNLKGNEYALCVLYLGLFPVYYTYLFKE